VLERLVTDRGFQAALRADPASALRGYQLDEHERALLHAQVQLGDGADRVVEDRVSKSGIVGMVGPIVSGLGFIAPPEGAPAGVGPVSAAVPEGIAEFGVAAPEGVPELGVAQVHVEAGLGGPTAVGEFGVADVQTDAIGYHTRVDADGDGAWDAHRAVERGDGGVDILVDRDGDGVVDWIGHDDDRDGLLESADYDRDGDGSLDTRAVDDTGDGWFDRRTDLPG
jgi:hypothetical protein